MLFAMALVVKLPTAQNALRSLTLYQMDLCLGQIEILKGSESFLLINKVEDTSKASFLLYNCRTSP